MKSDTEKTEKIVGPIIHCSPDLTKVELCQKTMETRCRYGENDYKL